MHDTTKTTKAPALALALVAAALAAALAAAMSLGVTSAYAGGGAFDIKLLSGSKTGLSYNSSEIDWWNTYTYISKKKISGVKSSNPKVLKIKGKSDYSFALQTKKTGKAKLTYKLGGKKKSVTVVVKKYKNPLKSFKVGGQECAKQYKKRCYGETSSVKDYCIVGKVNIKPAKSWKIKVLNAYTGTGLKKMKNKSTIPADTTALQVIMQNKKTKVKQRIYLYCKSEY